MGRWGPVASRALDTPKEQEGARKALIVPGFLIALVGTAGVSFYILGLSSLFVGSTTRGFLELVVGMILFLGFFRWLARFLEQLETRSEEKGTEAVLN